MRRISLLLITVAIALSASTASAQICQHFGAQCPQTSPCCNQGYCDSGGLFCGSGCDPAASYPDACYPKYPCVSYSETFDDPSKLTTSPNWNGDPDGVHWISQFDPSYAAIQNGELQLWMRKDAKLNSFGRTQGFGATVYNTRWFHYGTVTARVKSGAGMGVVSSFITKADPNSTVPVPDEIDFEYVGRLPTAIYSNIFALNELDYTKGQVHSMSSDTHNNWHTLSIVWMPDYIRWLIDGNVVRTLFKNQSYSAQYGGYQFPTEEARISFSIWDGGQGADGTAEWAGTPTDWSLDPNPKYVMSIDSFEVQCLFSAPTTTRQTTTTATATSSAAAASSSSTISLTGAVSTRTGTPPVPQTMSSPAAYQSTLKLDLGAATGGPSPVKGMAIAAFAVFVAALALL